MPKHQKKHYHRKDDDDDDDKEEDEEKEAHSSSSKRRSSHHSNSRSSNKEKKKKRASKRSRSSSSESSSNVERRASKSTKTSKDKKHRREHKQKKTTRSEGSSRKEKDRHKSGAKDDRVNDTALQNITPISRDDYFLKNPEFRVWLKNAKDIVFDDLDATEAREYFQTFVEKWNTGKLPGRYYSGSMDSAFEKETRTRHQWNFAKKLTEDEKLQLDSTKDSVFNSTRRDDELQKSEE